MRVLRLSRTPLENAVHRATSSSGFERLLQQISSWPGKGGQVLSLVEDDQLEAQLASEVVVEAITRAHGPALDAVERRFASMVGVAELEPGLNPLSPPSLANGMQAAQAEHRAARQPPRRAVQDLRARAGRLASARC